ncbi:MAG: Tfp pilus assembly protein FimT/FimU [Candidatus Zixiibacteriota bacterium]
MGNIFKSKRGITLVELLGTVVIIGIVSAMAVPRFQSAVERIKFRSTNRDIISTLRLARSAAIANKENFGVYFDNNELTMTLFKKDSSTSTDYTFEFQDSVIVVDSLPPEFSMLSTDIADNAVIFKSNGTANFNGGGNIVTMVYTEDMIGIYSINILASTGRVKSMAYYY